MKPRGELRLPLFIRLLAAPAARVVLGLLVLACTGLWGLEQMLAPANLVAWLAAFTLCF